MLSELFNPSFIDAAEQELTYITENNIKYHYFEDDDYPQPLKHCIDAPMLLFYSGNINLNAERFISIVGTRKMTSYGQDFCEELVNTFSTLKPNNSFGFRLWYRYYCA